MQARHLFYPMVLIFCVEFRELSHLTRDLSQAERKKKWLLSQACHNVMEKLLILDTKINEKLTRANQIIYCLENDKMTMMLSKTPNHCSDSESYYLKLRIFYN